MNASDIQHVKELLAEADKRYNQRFEAQEKNMALTLTAADKALKTASEALERRLDSVNEFRAQLKDQTATFITRAEAMGWVGTIVGLFTAIVFGLSALFGLIMLLQKITP